jgi:hypothetical protein
MDGLALLCNLHADGPLSLRRLRGSGVEALDDLGGLSEEALAAMLRSSPSQVRRFQHEGRLLSRRLKELPLESEFTENAPIPGEVRARLLKQIVRPPVAYDTNPPDETTSEEAPEAEDRPEREPTLFDEEPGEPGLVVVSPGGTALRSGEIPGLDSRTCQRLVAQGVRTYRALVDLANLNLARRTGIPFTRLLDLRHHARVFLQGRLMPERQIAIKPRVATKTQLAIKPEARRVSEPPRALRMERVVQEPIPVSSEPPESTTPARHDDPGVAGPFV